MPLLPHMNIFSWTSKFIIILIVITICCNGSYVLIFESKSIFSWTSKFIIILIEMTRMMMNNPNLMYESEHASPWINTSIKCKLVRATYHWISDIPGHPTDNNCTAWLLTCPSPPRDSISYQVACKTDAKPQSAWISTCFASIIISTSIQSSHAVPIPILPGSIACSWLNQTSNQNTYMSHLLRTQRLPRCQYFAMIVWKTCNYVGPNY